MTDQAWRPKRQRMDNVCVPCARSVKNDRLGKWGMHGRHAFEAASRMSYCQAVYREPA